jgi:cupin 2 domain-containing protein
MVQELKTVLFENREIKIEEIKSLGVATAPGNYYEQDEDEYVYIKKGNAKLNLDGKILELKPGDHLLIKKKIKHRVEETTFDCIWYCIFLKVRK